MQQASICKIQLFNKIQQQQKSICLGNHTMTNTIIN